MAKKKLTTKRKTEGVFLRLTPAFKKEARIFAINKGLTLTDLFVDAVQEKMDRG